MTWSKFIGNSEYNQLRPPLKTGHIVEGLSLPDWWPYQKDQSVGERMKTSEVRSPVKLINDEERRRGSAAWKEV